MENLRGFVNHEMSNEKKQKGSLKLVHFQAVPKIRPFLYLAR